MFEEFSTLWETIVEYIDVYMSWIYQLFDSMQLIVGLPYQATLIFGETLGIFPAYLIAPFTAIILLVVVLRVWAIITSGG